MSTRRYVSPLRYPGGKARMSPYLEAMFTQQVSVMDVEVWLEPFAGGAGAGLSLLDADAVGEIWLTEKNPALAALWRTMLTDPETLATRVERTTPDLDLWAWVRAQVADAGRPGTTDADAGFAALVLNRCSRSGMVNDRVGPIGGTNQDGPWTLASRDAPALAARIRHVGHLSARIRFTQGDAVVAIADLAGSGIEDEVLAFVDPPYLREGNRLYANGMDAADHQRLADALNASPVRWMLTYDDEPAVAADLYPRPRVMAYRIANTANRARIATEDAVVSDNLVLPEPRELVPGAESTWVRERPAAAA